MHFLHKQRFETKLFVICGLIGIVGVWFWTKRIGACIAMGGLASLIGECALAITRRLDAIVQNASINNITDLSYITKEWRNSIKKV